MMQCIKPIPISLIGSGLQFRAVKADTGAIGGDGSHEFHVLADSARIRLHIAQYLTTRLISS
jgi:prolyl-tRNA synthetase